MHALIAMPSGAEWLILLAVVLLLFGAKKLPDLARSLGRSARILKSETQGLHEDGTVEGQAAASSPAAIPAAPEARAAVPVTPEVDQNAADTLAANPVPEAAEGQTKPTAS